MKAIFSLAVAVLFTIGAFAQESKKEKKADADAKPKYNHECYMMKDGVLLHHMDDKTEAIKIDVKLKNGTVLTPTGNMMTYDGTKTQLLNGQCVSLMGGVGECEEMHEAK